MDSSPWTRRNLPATSSRCGGIRSCAGGSVSVLARPSRGTGPKWKGAIRGARSLMAAMHSSASGSIYPGKPRHLRVVIFARLIPGETGGIEQATSSLVAALGNLMDSDDEYVVLTDRRAPDW